MSQKAEEWGSRERNVSEGNGIKQKEKEVRSKESQEDEE
jgi:hypothetical protein